MTELKGRQLTAAAAVLVAAAVAVAVWTVVQHFAGPGGSARQGAEHGAVAAGSPGATRSGPARLLTYAEGRTLHLGRRTVATRHDLLSLDVVDGGAVFTTLDGGVWFTDGSPPVLVGITSPGSAHDGAVTWGQAGRPDEWVVSDNSGSHFAWLEYPTGDRPEIVVHDARTRTQVARVPVDVKASCRRCVQIVSVSDRAVYWTTSLWRGLGSLGEGRDSPRPFRFVYDADGAGRSVPVRLGALREDLLSHGRMLLVGDSAELGRLTDGIGQDFAVDGGHLTKASDALQVFDPRTGEPLRFRAPARYGYGIVERLRLVQWLDDDRFVLLDATGWNAGDFTGEDFLVCRISTTRCTVALTRAAVAGSPIVPEIATPGAAQALARATGG